MAYLIMGRKRFLFISDRFSNLHRRIPSLLFFKRNKSGTAAVEFAILAPVFLLILMGMIAFGLYLGVANAVQQLAEAPVGSGRGSRQQGVRTQHGQPLPSSDTFFHQRIRKGSGMPQKLCPCRLLFTNTFQPNASLHAPELVLAVITSETLHGHACPPALLTSSSRLRRPAAALRCSHPLTSSPWALAGALT